MKKAFLAGLLLLSLLSQGQRKDTLYYGPDWYMSPMSVQLPVPLLRNAQELRDTALPAIIFDNESDTGIVITFDDGFPFTGTLMKRNAYTIHRRYYMVGPYLVDSLPRQPSITIRVMPKSEAQQEVVRDKLWPGDHSQGYVKHGVWVLVINRDPKTNKFYSKLRPATRSEKLMRYPAWDLKGTK